MCIIWGLGFPVLSVLIHLVGKPGAHRILETLPDWLVRSGAEGKRPKRQMKEGLVGYISENSYRAGWACLAAAPQGRVIALPLCGRC